MVEGVRQRLEVQEKEWQALLGQFRAKLEGSGASVSSEDFRALHELGANIAAARRRLEGTREAGEGAPGGAREAAESARLLTETIGRALGRFSEAGRAEALR